MSATADAAIGVTRVPFLDLERIHAPLKAEILADVAALIDSSAFTNGPAVATFERRFAAWSHSAGCAGTASGLDALRLGLEACGVRPGTEVVVPANTFVATVEAVVQAGGTPVLADVSARDYQLDPDAVATAITARTRCLLPVHLYGQMADMGRLATLAARHDLAIVEDACQAHGARRDGRRAGTVGHAGAFSFYPGKNLGAMGDAGALVADDTDLLADVRARREHGQRTKHRHDVSGYTARLDSVQALVLLRKLPRLDGWNAERAAIAAAYAERLRGVGDLALLPVPDGSEPVWHVYPVRTADAGALGDFLGAVGIATGRHYPVPVHLQPAFRHLGVGRGSFPVSEALAEELLSLPMFPGLRIDEIDAVTERVRRFFP